MKILHARQIFDAPIEKVFPVVSAHTMISEALPLVTITHNAKKKGVGSRRAIGLPQIQPLKEEITAYKPPYRLEYEIVGLLKHTVEHHRGIIECIRLQGSTDTDTTEQKTQVDYYIELTAKPKILTAPVAFLLKNGIKRALAYHAKNL